MIQVLDPNKKGRAIAQVTFDKEKLKGFDYKAENLTISDLIKHGVVDCVDKIQLSVNVFRSVYSSSLDDKIKYVGEFSSSSLEGFFNSYVTFEVEFNNEDTERWRTKEIAKLFEGRCYKCPYSDDAYIKILGLNQTYESDFPYYNFNAIEINHKLFSIKQTMSTVSMFDIEEKRFEFISDEEFKKKFDEVINSLKNKI